MTVILGPIRLDICAVPCVITILFKISLLIPQLRDRENLKKGSGSEGKDSCA